MANNNKKKVGRPNPFIYYACALLMGPLYRMKYGLRIHRDGIKKMKGPALVLAQHLSGKDHILTALTLMPHRVTFVASEHFWMNPVLAKFFNMMRLIPKKMFCADIATIIKMKRAKEEGNIIVLFPEGRLPATGESVPVTEGTAQLVKKLGIDVYFTRSEGAYLTFPKWGTSPRKGGKINAVTRHVLTAQQIKNLSVSQIDAILQDTFAYSEHQLPTMKYKTKDTTAGLNNLLWQCPQCKKNGTLATENGHVTCSCGFDAILHEDYRLENAPFENIGSWYDWQAKNLYDTTSSLVSKVTLGTPGADGKLVPNAGQGIAALDRDLFTLDGELNGKPLHFSIDVKTLAGLPITVGEHFDVYDKGQLIYVYPEPNHATAMQWVTFLDEILKHKKN